MMYQLQLFAEAVQGKKMVYLYRIQKDATTADGTILASTTENGCSKSKDADSTATKDGSIRTTGTAEVEITTTSILAKGDRMIDKLEDAYIDETEGIEALFDEVIEELRRSNATRVKVGAGKELKGAGGTGEGAEKAKLEEQLVSLDSRKKELAESESYLKDVMVES
ncbi:MAG: phage major tail protein, TP901-1 family [Dorea sp.]|nr:phage major tail protein, TP901-1 family [Dorea sp.]